MIARTSSTTVDRSQPAAQAWQVSSTNPAPNSPTASHNRASASSSRAMACPAGGVLDEHRHGEAAVGGLPLEQLAPVVEARRRVVLAGDVPAVHDHPGRSDVGRCPGVLAEQLAAGDADAVVGRGHVEHVGGVHEDHQVGRAQLVGVGAGLGRRPALRVGEEHLDGGGVDLGGPASTPPSSTSLPSVRPEPTCTPTGCDDMHPNVGRGGDIEMRAYLPGHTLVVHVIGVTVGTTGG